MKEIQNENLKQQLISDSGYLEKFSVDVVRDTRLFHAVAGDYIVKEGLNPRTFFTSHAAGLSFTPHQLMVGSR